MTLGQRNYYMKAGNTHPPLTLYLVDEKGNIPSFAGVDQVEFFVWKKGEDTYHVRKFGAVDDPATGAVEMQWEDGDTDDPGVYHVLVDLIRDGARETFPGQGDGTLVIEGRPALA